ncbi:putative necrosis-inducing factor-domain-containing protein [Cladorrhinum sp. PSN259]|nr:putative necrosis-inducing factor-domain-containing protein [Cladorrhinum sp. PSN259]
MKLSKQQIILAITALLGATVQAAPADPAPTSPVTTPLDAAQKTLCHDYSWENQVSKGSPPVEDCEELYTFLGKPGKDKLNWTVGDIQHKICYWGRCYIGGQRTGAKSGTSSLGNEDLRAIIRKSIDDYKYTFDDGVTRVGTKGQLQCNGDDWVDWGLYHSP